MNNTKTLAAIAAILIAGTLVVAGTLAATSATSAFAYQKKRGQDDSKNGSTVTIQACKQKGSVSGFDNRAEQECGNTICTHPGENATCVSESEGAVTTTSTSTSSTTSPPIPVNAVTCTNTQSTPFTGQLAQQCCIIVQNNITAGTTQTNAATNACTIAVTNAGGIAGSLPTGTTVPISAMSLKTSDEKCVNGASGSLNTGTGRTFSICVGA